MTTTEADLLVQGKAPANLRADGDEKVEGNGRTDSRKIATLEPLQRPLQIMSGMFTWAVGRIKEKVTSQIVVDEDEVNCIVGVKAHEKLTRHVKRSTKGQQISN